MTGLSVALTRWRNHRDARVLELAVIMEARLRALGHRPFVVDDGDAAALGAGYCGIGRSGFQSLRSGDGPERWWEYDISDVFIKALPSDLMAAIGLAQLGRLDALQQRRKEIWRQYQQAFADVAWLETPAEPADHEQHSYFTYFVQVPQRDELAHHLRDKGIYTTLRFHPLHLNAVYGETGSLPNAERLNQVGLNLPLHPRLSDEDVRHVVASVLGSRPAR